MITYNREIVMIRNVPVRTLDVIRLQEELEAQLFDESVFHDPVKKVACAQVIHTLDTEYNRYEMTHGHPPVQLDIGDGAWVYLPVPMFQDASIVSLRTKDKPAGIVAWFRRKKIYAVATNRRNFRLS